MVLGSALTRPLDSMMEPASPEPQQGCQGAAPPRATARGTLHRVARGWMRMWGDHRDPPRGSRALAAQASGSSPEAKRKLPCATGRAAGHWLPGCGGDRAVRRYHRTLLAPLLASSRHTYRCSASSKWQCGVSVK